MQGQVVDTESEVSEVSRKLALLARKPRVLTFVCVSDGYAYHFKDDGGYVAKTGEVVMNALRARIFDLMQKQDKSKQPLFYAAERVSSGAFDASVTYKPSPVAPVYPGDPIAHFQVIDDAAIARIHANQAERADMYQKANQAKAERVLDALTTVANRTLQDAPRIKRRENNVKA
jgi:hypothetical protein